MELAEGEDLAQRVARAPLSVGEALTVAQQIAEALEAAHERGIVHRDLKPANVMLTDEGRVKVLDFGLAKAFEEDRAGSDIAITQSPTLTAGMTQAGMILGTAGYMSPEQAVGKVVDKRTDIWAFGCVLFELLVGRQSFAGGTERLIAARGRQPRFSPDGRWIAYWTGGRGTATEIYVVESGGGTPRRLVEEFAAASSPVWSPDSDFILFWGISSSVEESRVVDWWTIRLDDGSPAQTGVFDVLRSGGLRSHDVSAWVTGPERLLVTALAGHSQSVWELPFSESARRVAGQPERLTAGTGLDGSPSLVVSEEGTQLFFSRSASIVNLWRLPVEADTARVVGAPQQLTDSVAMDTWPSVSANGQRIAYASTRFGSRDIWMKDLTTGAETALTMMPGSERTPRISPDGSRVTFLGSEGQYVVTAEGGTPSLLTDETGWATDWPSAEMILVVQDRGISQFDIATQSLAPLIQEMDRSFYFGVASPDLRWFSFMEWLQADRTRLFIAPLGEGPIPESEWIAVTDGQHVDEENAWSPDGTILYFMSERDGRRCLWAQRLDPATKQLQGDLLAVMHSHDMRHAMMPTKGGPQNIDVTQDSLYFSMQELASNIWMATLER